MCSLIVGILVAIATPVFAWISFKKEILFYSPLSSPESIYIGAGHTELRGLNDVSEDKFEDIRYLYFEGIDLTDGKTDPNNYSDHVFCVFGRGVPNYKIQLAFTTNNDFRYEIYEATETTNKNDPGVVASHETHEETPRTFYYIKGNLLQGSYLNKDGENLQAFSDDEYYEMTFQTESSGVYEYVNSNAIPIYWQNSNRITANINGAFVHYYILRIIEGEKRINDKETDVVCISARAH